MIRRRGPWKNVDHVELATLEWVDWHDDRRLHTARHDLTPVEYEQVFYGNTQRKSAWLRWPADSWRAGGIGRATRWPVAR